MGYRWFDQQNLAPLFPFGHGLSCTAFAYSTPKIDRAKDGGFDLAFTVRNTGKTAGDEGPQLYLRPPPTQSDHTQFALKALAAFERIHLAGQSKPVTLHVPARKLQHRSTAESQWKTPAGERRVCVAASSRDMRLQSLLRAH